MTKIKHVAAALALGTIIANTATATVNVTAAPNNTDGKTFVGQTVVTDQITVGTPYTPLTVSSGPTAATLTATNAAGTVIRDAVTTLPIGNYVLSTATVSGATSSGLDVGFSSDGTYQTKLNKNATVSNEDTRVHIITATTTSVKLGAGNTTIAYTLTQYGA